MILMILGFLFVYSFVVALYYLLQHNNRLVSREAVSIKRGFQRGIPLTDAGKLYSEMINIPILDDSRDAENVDETLMEQSEEMKICKSCDRSLPGDSKFCIYCGSML